MDFREVIKEDYDFMADHSISRGKVMPAKIDYINTLEHEGNILCLGGFRIINKSTAWCWIDISDSAGGHTVSMYRVIRDWIDQFCEDHKLVRIQAYVECDFTEAIRLVQHLGFEKESIMKNFVENKDAFMYRKII